MSLSLRAMRYVQSAMRRGSIVAAAEAMHVAPSAIATALSQAETAFGVALVTRARSKGVAPTRAGRDVLRRIEDLLDRYDAMLADVSDLQGGLSGTLTVGYNAPIAPSFLPAIAEGLRREHPGLTLSFFDGDNTAVREGLLQGQFDAIVFVEDLPSPQIEAHPLIYAPTYCLCAADHPFAKCEAVTVDRILNEPLVLLDRPAARGYYMDLLEQGGGGTRIVATSNATEMVRSLVAVGTGVSLLNMRPRELATYAGGAVCCVPVANSDSGVTLSLGVAPGPRRRMVQVFADACMNYFQSSAGSDLIVHA